MRRYWRWHIVAPAKAWLYRRLGRQLSWWPLRPCGRRARRLPAPEARRIAYYLRTFPVLSETFIQREVLALRRAGLDVQVLAHEADGAEHFDHDARALQASTHYLPLVPSQGIPPVLWALAARHPLRLANAFVWLVLRQHLPHKDWRRDRHLFNQVLHLAGELRARGIDHVHCPWASPDATVALLAADLVDARYTVQARAYDIHRHSTAFGRRERLQQAAFLITNTRYNAGVLAALVPQAAAAGRIHIIHNGLELTRFTPPEQRPPGVPPRLLCIARLTEQKGLAVLLHACALLRDAAQVVRCDIIGGRVASEVNHYLALKKLHRRLELQGIVQFAGPQPFASLLPLYAAADVFVLPAIVAPDGGHDITPNALLEAMAMRCAVVSTPIGGIAEIVEDGVSGLLVPAGDATALARAIVRLLHDPGLRTRLGTAARRRIEEQFDIDRNIARYVSLFAGDGSATP
jgi:glycosyltransferase involved in cell wall biosynthesis